MGNTGFNLPDEAWATEDSAGLVTGIWMNHEDQPSTVLVWSMQRGDILSASAEEPGLRVVLGGGVHGRSRGSGFWFHVTLPEAVGAQPLLSSCEEIPGLSACSSVRTHLQDTLVSPSRNVFALVEAQGRNCVNVFGTPQGKSRAATSAVLWGGEACFGAVLT